MMQFQAVAKRNYQRAPDALSSRNSQTTWKAVIEGDPSRLESIDMLDSLKANSTRLPQQFHTSEGPTYRKDGWMDGWTNTLYN